MAGGPKDKCKMRGGAALSPSAVDLFFFLQLAATTRTVYVALKVRQQERSVWYFFHRLYAAGRAGSLVAGGAGALILVGNTPAAFVAAFHLLAYSLEAGLTAASPTRLLNGALRQPGIIIVLLILSVMVVVIVPVIVIVVFVLLD